MSTTLPEMPASYIDSQLALLADQLQGPAYPGYPEQAERLVATTASIGRTATGALIFPDGNWMVPARFANHSDLPYPGYIASYNLGRAGYAIDSCGRPLHPWFNRMLEDPRLGVVGGKGAYWNWGPNRTADSVIVHDDSILLVERGDTGAWALPGGYIDGNETAIHAARRETREETHVVIDGTWGNQLYKGLVVDPRMTAHAWPETTAFLFKLDSTAERPEAVGNDDAKSAEWVPIAELDRRNLFGSHRFLAQLALNQLLVADSM